MSDYDTPPPPSTGTTTTTPAHAAAADELASTGFPLFTVVFFAIILIALGLLLVCTRLSFHARNVRS